MKVAVAAATNFFSVRLAHSGKLSYFSISVESSWFHSTFVFMLLQVMIHLFRLIPKEALLGIKVALITEKSESDSHGNHDREGNYQQSWQQLLVTRWIESDKCYD